METNYMPGLEATAPGSSPTSERAAASLLPL